MMRLPPSPNRMLVLLSVEEQTLAFEAPFPLNAELLKALQHRAGQIRWLLCAVMVQRPPMLSVDRKCVQVTPFSFVLACRMC